MQIYLPVWLLVVGRILFVSYFVTMGTSHLLKFQEHSAHLARKHVPLPRVVTVLTFLMMVGGSLSILFEVPGATLIAAIFLHQHVRLEQLPAAALLLGGLALVIRSGTRSMPAE